MDNTGSLKVKVIYIYMYIFNDFDSFEEYQSGSL